MSNYTLYKLYKLQRRPISGGTWEDFVPTAYSYDGDGTMEPVVVEENSTQCGYVPPINPEYRWVNMDSATQYYCSGTTKYYKQKKQISVDSGVTWNDMSPMEYRMGSSAETNSVDCGGGFEPQYKWENITPTSDPSSYWCDDCPTPPSPTGYSDQYLTFVATESGTFKFSGNSINYSLDSGITWTSLASNTYTPTVSAGTKVMWKATLTPNSYYEGIGIFSSTNRFTAEGNPMSLLYGDNFSGQTSLNGKSGAFANMFESCSGLTSAENLSLPATTLAERCYNSMFFDCENLTTAPQLPATILATSCYGSMFWRCKSLTTAPQLPATTLANYCYFAMFQNCISLTTAPNLPATTLASDCYRFMFINCTSLTTAPQLPATTLAERCYGSMFYDCTSLNSVTCLATDISADLCTLLWLKNVYYRGTFTKAANMNNWPSGDSGIPNGWTVVNYTS